MATERDTLAQLIASHVSGQFDSEMPSACGDAADAILSAGYQRRPPRREGGTVWIEDAAGEES